MNVDTPPGVSDWKNVEIKGYAKILSVIDPNKDNDCLGKVTLMDELYPKL
jgi:hypothetical protein